MKSSPVPVVYFQSLKDPLVFTKEPAFFQVDLLTI